MARKETLEKLVDAHWAAMEHPQSDRGVAWDSYCKIRDEAMALGDQDVVRFLKDDNYAIVNESNPNFGLSGLPVVVFLCKKYGFPLNSGYKALQAQHMQKQRQALAEDANKMRG